MLGFDKPFTVDYDARGVRRCTPLGAGPLAFLNRPFAARHLKLAAYERELINLVQAVRHWRPYLWGRHLIPQVLAGPEPLHSATTSVDQQALWVRLRHGVPPGTTLSPVVTLSTRRCRREARGQLPAPSPVPRFALIDNIRTATQEAPDAQLLVRRLQQGELPSPWRMEDGLLLHGARIFVPRHGDLRHQVLRLAHSADHEGIQKTLHRLCSEFYIPGLGPDLRHVPAEQDRDATPNGLATASQVWANISLDFIEGLVKVGGKSVMLTVVDRFSKYAHFIALGGPYTTASVARAFFEGIVCTGSPLPLEPVFTGHVWRGLFKMAGVTLRMSTTFHPQMDRQSEVVNKVIAMYLLCVTAADVAGLAAMGGILLQHVLPYNPAVHALRGGLRPAGPDHSALSAGDGADRDGGLSTVQPR
ncbi:LOW QUALITY PROTEIN: hypothetical protein U9M48_036462 [Paspalum notatum var. saurae]|uniref:Integrase catalytic domain-containing protein n=1 Tax=Paspalum notatum var. saurae TaxID=547442 RepID=A0AAQ3XB58_PASNO